MPNSKQTILPINSQSDNYVRRMQVSDAIKLSGFQFWSAKDDLKLHEQIRLQLYPGDPARPDTAEMREMAGRWTSAHCPSRNHRKDLDAARGSNTK